MGSEAYIKRLIHTYVERYSRELKNIDKLYPSSIDACVRVIINEMTREPKSLERGEYFSEKEISSYQNYIRKKLRCVVEEERE